MFGMKSNNNQSNSFGSKSQVSRTNFGHKSSIRNKGNNHHQAPQQEKPKVSDLEKTSHY